MVEMDATCLSDAIESAVTFGHMSIAEWALDEGGRIPLHKTNSVLWHDETTTRWALGSMIATRKPNDARIARIYALFRHACKEGRLGVAMVLYTRAGATDFRYGLLYASANGHDNVGMLTPNDIAHGMYQACKNGHADTATKLSEMNVVVTDPSNSLLTRRQPPSIDEWRLCFNAAMVGACAGNSLKLANWAKSHGGQDIEEALYVAAVNNHMQMIEWAVSKGAKDFNGILHRALKIHHRHDDEDVMCTAATLKWIYAKVLSQAAASVNHNDVPSHVHQPGLDRN